MHKDNNMPRKWLRTFEMHSNHKEYKNNIKKAKENINEILNSNYRPIIEYSGGKDSLVLLHLIMQKNKEIPVYYSDSGYDYDSQQVKMPIEMTKEIIKIGKQVGAKYLYSCGHKDPNSKRYFGNLFRVMKKHDCNLELLGIRAGESVGRKHRTEGALIRKEGSRVLSFPIRDLTVIDVWTYLVTNDIKYLSYYDEYAKIDGYEDVRLSSRFSKGLLHKGGSLYMDGVLMPEYRNQRPKDWNK